MKQMQTKSVALELEYSDDESRVVKGYGSVFGNLDSDNDVIKSGSFKRTIKSWGPEGKNRIKLVSQHDISRPVAAITKMYEDEKGLYFEAKFGTHTDGEDHYRMVKDGILTEFSIGFVPLKYDKNDNGGINIEEIKLYEISLVTVASNDEALVTDVKAEDIVEEIVDKVAALDKEKGHEVENLLLKLANAFEVTTQPASDSTPGGLETPDVIALDSVVEKADDLTELAKAFNLNKS